MQPKHVVQNVEVVVGITETICAVSWFLFCRCRHQRTRTHESSPPTLKNLYLFRLLQAHTNLDL